MPVYNGEIFIREALDSLLAQTFSNFELIISDNASTDETEAICREFSRRDSRIRYVRQSENQGAVNNFLFVLDKAVGEYFMWAAADDIWDRRWIEVLLPMTIERQCLSYGMVQTIDANGVPIIHSANSRPFEFSGNVLFRRLKYFCQPGFYGKPNPIYGIFPKKIMSQDLLVRMASAKCGGDMLLLYSVLERCEIKFGGEVILRKRLHANCAGGAAVGARTKQSYFGRAMCFVGSLVKTPMLFEYAAASSRIEKIVMVLVYPLIIFHLLFLAINYKFSRVKLIP
jgi:glycosyltransferase involved in cell wall biosynthesis